MSEAKGCKEEDVAEVIAFLKKHTQYYKASLVTYLYNFYRMQAGIEPKQDTEGGEDE